MQLLLADAWALPYATLHGKNGHVWPDSAGKEFDEDTVIIGLVKPTVK
jgi:hypothetical protein